MELKAFELNTINIIPVIFKSWCLDQIDACTCNIGKKLLCLVIGVIMLLKQCIYWKNQYFLHLELNWVCSLSGDH